MRQIKFRGKILKADGKVELFYQENQYLLSFLRRLSSRLIWEQTGKKKEHESYLEGDLESYLERWTGLLDKNGKEIYEGDVVRMNYFTKDHTSNELEPRVAVVEWWEIGFATWILPERQYCNLNWAQGIGKAEIIGNIHENPDLLTP